MFERVALRALDGIRWEHLLMKSYGVVVGMSLPGENTVSVGYFPKPGKDSPDPDRAAWRALRAWSDWHLEEARHQASLHGQEPAKRIPLDWLFASTYPGRSELIPHKWTVDANMLELTWEQWKQCCYLAASGKVVLNANTIISGMRWIRDHGAEEIAAAQPPTPAAALPQLPAPHPLEQYFLPMKRGRPTKHDVRQARLMRGFPPHWVPAVIELTRDVSQTTQHNYRSMIRRILRTAGTTDLMACTRVADTLGDQVKWCWRRFLALKGPDQPVSQLPKSHTPKALNRSLSKIKDREGR